MTTTVRHRLWAGLNLLGLVVTLVMNGLANGLPLNGKTTGDLSGLYPNLFVPAGLTFSIWGLIYLLLLGFVGLQVLSAMRGAGQRARLDDIGPWFLVSSVANSLWLVAWHYVVPAVALLLMLLLLGSLLAMYLRLDVGRAPSDAMTRLLVTGPISVYLGWISVATIANVTTVLVDRGYGELWPGPVFWTVAVVLVAVLLAALIQRRGDLGYAGVVVWALVGIYIKRSADTAAADAPVEAAALIGIAVVVLLAAARVVSARRASA
jgi:hypothetical protein